MRRSASADASVSVLTRKDISSLLNALLVPSVASDFQCFGFERSYSSAFSGPGGVIEHRFTPLSPLNAGKGG
jgi:hypothetical protein